MTLATIGAPTVEGAFATHRTRTPRVIEPKTLAAVTALLTQHGMVQGQTFYEATKDETDVYNGQRETAAKTAGTEAPTAIDVAAMAARKAKSIDGAGGYVPYVQAALDANASFAGKSYSVRTVNQGTADHPKVLWAIVLVNAREKKASK